MIGITVNSTVVEMGVGYLSVNVNHVGFTWVAGRYFVSDWKCLERFNFDHHDIIEKKAAKLARTAARRAAIKAFFFPA